MAALGEYAVSGRALYVKGEVEILIFRQNAGSKNELSAGVPSRLKRACSKASALYGQVSNAVGRNSEAYCAGKGAAEYASLIRPTRWLDLHGRYNIGVVEREKGAEIARRVRPADAA